MGLFNSDKPKKAPKAPKHQPVKPAKTNPRRTTQTPKRGSKPGK
jgi:hypothetical protein